jgi:hypothetical protein
LPEHILDNSNERSKLGGKGGRMPPLRQNRRQNVRQSGKSPKGRIIAA